MGVGIIILLVVLIVAAVVGVGLFATSARLRAKKLAPEGDKVEGVVDADAERHPEHVAVANDEQHTRFVGPRE
jgi:Na+-transporting methylmalonyl-CoA/oxaloacetate decarboxylase gamma subunit